MIKIKIAELSIGINNRFEYLEALTKDYLTDEPPVFTVSATDEQIEAERRISQYEFSEGYLESIVVYRQIAERLPFYDAFVFHGAVLNMDGCAYAFTAKSGVGKTTHTRLWLQRFGDRVHYLNGDKPVIRYIDGVPYAFGTPYNGKEGYGTNECAPLCGIAFLSRGETNEASPADADEVVMRFVSQVYMSRNQEAVLRTMSLCDSILKDVRLVKLACNMDIDAAEVAYRALVESPREEQT